MFRRVSLIVVVLLLIEFLDELVIGTRQAALPLLRSELKLTYSEMGVLLSLPVFLGSLIEPIAGILSDLWKRRALVMICGIAFAAAVMLIAIGQSFPVALLGFILFAPASGALVGLAQAVLVDSDQGRIEQNMARWTFAGSVGSSAGPIALGIFLWAGLGWRMLFVVMAVMTLAVILYIRRTRFPKRPERLVQQPRTFRQGIRNTMSALKKPEVVRWLGLLQFSELMMDILLGYLALYFVDVAKTNAETAALAISVWAIAALLGDLLLIPVLERVQGVTYLRVSAVIEGFLFIIFMLTPGLTSKIMMLALLGFFRAGWYSILKAQLYMVMPGQSGTVMTINNVGGLFRSLLPLGIGVVAQRFGLETAMWLLLLGPISLLVGLPLTPIIRLPVISKRRTLVMQAIVVDELPDVPFLDEPRRKGVLHNPARS